MNRKEAGDSAYCPRCEFFVDIDDAGCCVECGRQILGAKKKPKKKEPKPS